MPPPCIPLCPCPPSPAHSHSPPHFTTSSHRQSWSDECEREAIKQFSLSATPQPRRKVIPPFPVLLGKRSRRGGKGARPREREREGPFHLPQIRIKKGQGYHSPPPLLLLLVIHCERHSDVRLQSNDVPFRAELRFTRICHSHVHRGPRCLSLSHTHGNASKKFHCSLSEDVQQRHLFSEGGKKT